MAAGAGLFLQDAHLAGRTALAERHRAAHAERLQGTRLTGLTEAAGGRTARLLAAPEPHSAARVHHLRHCHENTHTNTVKTLFRGSNRYHH